MVDKDSHKVAVAVGKALAAADRDNHHRVLAVAQNKGFAVVVVNMDQASGSYASIPLLALGLMLFKISIAEKGSNGLFRSTLCGCLLIWDGVDLHTGQSLAARAVWLDLFVT